jgi:hypothetical protein
MMMSQCHTYTLTPTPGSTFSNAYANIDGLFNYIGHEERLQDALNLQTTRNRLAGDFNDRA